VPVYLYYEKKIDCGFTYVDYFVGDDDAEYVRYLVKHEKAGRKLEIRR